MSKINTYNFIKMICNIFLKPIFLNCLMSGKYWHFYYAQFKPYEIIFQVSPNYPRPCQPCHCDPTGSLSEVCVKDEKYAQRGEAQGRTVALRKRSPDDKHHFFCRGFFSNSIHTVRILTSNGGPYRTPFFFTIITYFMLNCIVGKANKNIDHLP